MYRYIWKLSVVEVELYAVFGAVDNLSVAKASRVLKPGSSSRAPEYPAVVVSSSHLRNRVNSTMPPGCPQLSHSSSFSNKIVF